MLVVFEIAHHSCRTGLVLFRSTAALSQRDGIKIPRRGETSEWLASFSVLNRLGQQSRMGPCSGWALGGRTARHGPGPALLLD